MTDPIHPPAAPMFGERIVDVLEVSSVSIHSDLYYDIICATSDPARGVRYRLAQHLCSRPPVAGDRLTLSFLMGQVNEVAFASE